MASDAVNDERIRSLTDEVRGLRQRAQDANSEQQSTLLKVTEIQLNLAMQDRTIARIETTVNGNGRPGLVSRVMQLEQQAQASATRGRDWRKLGWLIVGALIPYVASMMPHLWSGK